MPDILYAPTIATQSEIVDCIERLRLGDMLVLNDRVVGLIAHTAAALSGDTQASSDRRYFALIDALLADSESPARNVAEAARYIVEQGIVSGDAPSEAKSLRIAKNYQKDHKLSQNKKSEIGRNAARSRWNQSEICRYAANSRWSSQ